MFKSIVDQRLLENDELFLSEQSILESFNSGYKKLDDTFIYNISEGSKYNDRIFKFITRGIRINTSAPEFRDISFDIRRRKISDMITKALFSHNVVLAIGPEPLPKPLKAFSAKDPKEDGKQKLFIDVMDFIKIKNGVYECNNLDWLISYLISGIVAYIYSLKPDVLLLDQVINSKGIDCFARLFSYIIDRIAKITSVPVLKMKIDYLAAMYYQINILQKEHKSESGFTTVRNNAIKSSNITDMDARSVDILLQENDFDNIDTFIKAIIRMFSINITTTAVIAIWMQAFQTGTQFALEFFPAFSAMMTHTYVNSFLVNQNLIEKICGTDMIIFSKQIFKIAEGAAS